MLKKRKTYSFRSAESLTPSNSAPTNDIKDDDDIEIKLDNDIAYSEDFTENNNINSYKLKKISKWTLIDVENFILGLI